MAINLSKSGSVGKAIVTIDYDSYVVDADDAITIANILSNAELYKEKWRKSEGGGTTYHVFEQDAKPPAIVKVLPMPLYKMYKLAGKPQEN